jgi:hypothetical protein
MYSSPFSLTSALVGGEWLTSRPSWFNPSEEPSYTLNTRVGGPRVDVDVLKKRNIS